MEKDKKEKQKKIFLLSLVFIILLFGTFVIAAIKFVNSDNNKGKISTKTPNTSTASISNEKVESNTIKKDTIESSTIGVSTESAKDNKEEKVNESDKEDKKTVEENTNESKEEVNTANENSQQSNSKKDTSINNSGNVSNNNSSNNNSSSEKNNNEEIKKEENKEEEKPKFIVNINIKMVDDTIFSSQIVLEKEVTAFEALKYYCENNSIQIGYTGSGQFVYVSSINGIKEKSEGPSSGWMYKVNGTFPDVSAGKYKLSSNDTLEWVFTKDGGKDVGQR